MVGSGGAVVGSGGSVGSVTSFDLVAVADRARLAGSGVVVGSPWVTGWLVRLGCGVGVR